MACQFCREDDERQKCARCGVEACHACWMPMDEENEGSWRVLCEACGKKEKNQKSKIEQEKRKKRLSDVKLLDIMRSKSATQEQRDRASDELTRRMKMREARRSGKK